MRECRLDADHVGSHTDLGILYGWRHQDPCAGWRRRVRDPRMCRCSLPRSGAWLTPRIAEQCRGDGRACQVPAAV